MLERQNGVRRRQAPSGRELFTALPSGVSSAMIVKPRWAAVITVETAVPHFGKLGGLCKLTWSLLIWLRIEQCIENFITIVEHR